LLHGGGWKKLEKKMINNIEFIKIAKEKLKFERVINYYGLVEQTGSIFVECEKCNNFLTSVYSEIFVVNKDFKKLDKGEVGYLQLLSLLPTSYPGHNILTEDLAKICGEDDCKCGKKGKYFKVLGRIKKAEIRGCSDAKI
jgi:phenylacetate-coenzyme A ligase PaaK-like adenylate-forming protein